MMGEESRYDNSETHSSDCCSLFRNRRLHCLWPRFREFCIRPFFSADGSSFSASPDAGALQYYIDAAVTAKDGKELTVLVEDTPMKLNLSEVENLYPAEIQTGDTIRISTSAESLDTFAVIENAERITAPE